MASTPPELIVAGLSLLALALLLLRRPRGGGYHARHPTPDAPLPPSRPATRPAGHQRPACPHGCRKAHRPGSKAHSHR